jgi:hypothetical protein
MDAAVALRDRALPHSRSLSLPADDAHTSAPGGASSPATPSSTPTAAAAAAIATDATAPTIRAGSPADSLVSRLAAASAASQQEAARAVSQFEGTSAAEDVLHEVLRRVQAQALDARAVELDAWQQKLRQGEVALTAVQQSCAERERTFAKQRREEHEYVLRLRKQLVTDFAAVQVWQHLHLPPRFVTFVALALVGRQAGRQGTRDFGMGWSEVARCGNAHPAVRVHLTHPHLTPHCLRHGPLLVCLLAFDDGGGGIGWRRRWCC